MNIPKVIVDLPMAGYAPECGEETLRVWVNPSLNLVDERKALLREYFRLATEKSTDEETAVYNQRLFEWMSAILSQDADPETHRSVAEIAEAHAAAPDVIVWIAARAARMIDEFGSREKKALMPR